MVYSFLGILIPTTSSREQDFTLTLPRQNGARTRTVFNTILYSKTFLYVIGEMRYYIPGEMFSHCIAFWGAMFKS